MPINTSSGFECLRLSDRCKGSITNSVNYRMRLVQVLYGSSWDDELFWKAQQEYAEAFPFHSQQIESCGTQNEVMAPTTVSEAIASALLATSKLLPLVNCVCLPFGNDEHGFKRERFRIIGSKSIIVSLLTCDARASHNLFGQLADLSNHIDKGIVARCLSTFADDGSGRDSSGLSSTDTATFIDVNEQQYRDRQFWQTIALDDRRTIGGMRTWAFNYHTSADLYAMHSYGSQRMLFRQPAVSLDSSVFKSFESADSGEVFGMYANFRSFTVNLPVGLPVFLAQPTGHQRGSRQQELFFLCDGLVTSKRGWSILRKA